jgi:hypothetical protein
VLVTARSAEGPPVDHDTKNRITLAVGLLLLAGSQVGLAGPERPGRLGLLFTAKGVAG